MLLKAGCKINLGLSILGRREDGFHNLETVIYPIPFYDMVEVVPAEDFSFSASGVSIDGDARNNLCVKAYQLVEEKFGLPPVKIHLHKVIPFGAGLGGGSSDAVAVLKLLISLFDLQINYNELLLLASRIGSDCPFFIRNKPALATGIGTNLIPADIDLKGYFLAIIKPDVSISTADAYGNISVYSPANRLQKAIQQPMHKWRQELVNDFEYSVFDLYPQLKEIKSALYKSGAIYSSMSGSGSALYGIFDKYPDIKLISEMNMRIIAL